MIHLYKTTRCHIPEDSGVHNALRHSGRSWCHVYSSLTACLQQCSWTESILTRRSVCLRIGSCFIRWGDTQKENMVIGERGVSLTYYQHKRGGYFNEKCCFYEHIYWIYITKSTEKNESCLCERESLCYLRNRFCPTSFETHFSVLICSSTAFRKRLRIVISEVR